MNRIKELLFMCVMFLLAACSAPMPGEDVAEAEDTGEARQTLTTPCSITGVTGSASWADRWYVTGMRIAPIGGGRYLVGTACQVSTGTCESATHRFDDVHWTPAHTVNGTIWAGSLAYPLRRVVVSAPGCMLSSPDKWCLDLRGDLDSNYQLQNSERFLSDRPINVGAIEAPPGYGITKFVGMDTNPINTWKMNYVNASATGIGTRNWTFTTPGCN